MLSEERVAAIRARVKARTKGKWRWLGKHGQNSDREDAPIYEDLGTDHTWVLSSGIMQRGNISFGCICVREADARFIVHAARDIRHLLAERDALLARIAELEQKRVFTDWG